MRPLHIHFIKEYSVDNKVLVLYGINCISRIVNCLSRQKSIRSRQNHAFTVRVPNVASDGDSLFLDKIMIMYI